MREIIAVSKSEAEERPVPNEWRWIFTEIVEAIRGGDFNFERSVDYVKPLHDEDMKEITNSIRSYGMELIALPADTWETSICRWMNGYWNVVVDLFTAEEGLSDLVLLARVYERKNGYEFEVRSVHVP